MFIAGLVNSPESFERVRVVAGRVLRPGEVSLDHNGILFLDELPEFPRNLLYVGVTNDVEVRAFRHNSKLIPGFTQKYNLYKLAYFKRCGNLREAIRREKQIRGWLRVRKVALSESPNPRRRDLQWIN